MRKAELAVRQDGRYDAVDKEIRAMEKTFDRAFSDTIPQLAAMLQRYLQLQPEIDVFNNPAPPHVLANPQDRLVKSYRPIKQPIPDAVLKGLRLVDKDGTVLYAHVDVPKATFRTIANGAASRAERAASEKEAFRQAQEYQRHAQTILRGLEHEAESRGISVEQAATIEGIEASELARYRDQAASKQVEAAQSALMAALDKAAELEKATS